MFITQSETEVNTDTNSQQVNDCPRWLFSQHSGETRVHTDELKA